MAEQASRGAPEQGQPLEERTPPPAIVLLDKLGRSPRPWPPLADPRDRGVVVRAD